MPAKNPDNQALVDAIREAFKDANINQPVEREIKILSSTIKEYVEKAASNADIKKVFTELADKFSKNIDDSIESQKEAGEKNLDSIRNKYNDLTKEMEKLVASKDFIEDYEVKLKKILKKQEAVSKEFEKEKENLNKAIKEAINASQAKLVEDLTTGIQEYGEEAFKTELKQTKDVDKSLIRYKDALRQQYEALEENEEQRKKLGITDKKLEVLKEEIADSYLKELDNLVKSDKLDQKTRKVVEEKLKRERIMMGKSTYEQTYGDRSSIGKLAGKLADFTTRRYKEQNEQTGEFSKIFTSGLGAIFRGKETKQPFLEPENPENKVAKGITQKDIVAGEGKNIIDSTISNTPKPQPETPTQETPVDLSVTKAETKPVTEDEEVIASKESVNTSPALETLQAIQQTLEDATDNVPLKVVISDLSSVAKKGMSEAFVSAISEIMGAFTGKPSPKLLEGPAAKPKKEKESGPIIDVDDLNKLGFFKRAARGIGRAAKGATGLARGGLAGAAGKVPLLGGLLNTGVGSLGTASTGAMLGAGALVAGTIAGGGYLGYQLEENFGVGTKTLEAVGVNKKENEMEKAQDELNGKLQEAAKIKDPTQKRIAFFEAQLENLEQQKTLQSGDEKAQTEKMITVVKTKLEKLKNPPKIEPAKSETKTTIPETTATPGATPAAPSAEASKVVQNISNMPAVTAKVPQPKDVTPELNTNNQLTEQTNQKLDTLIKVMAGKDYSPTNVTPVMVSQATPAPPAAQTQSPAYQFRTQNRTV